MAVVAVLGIILIGSAICVLIAGIVLQNAEHRECRRLVKFELAKLESPLDYRNYSYWMSLEEFGEMVKERKQEAEKLRNHLETVYG